MSQNLDETILYLEFDSNKYLSFLFGEQNVHLSKIERALKVSIVNRGNKVAISGDLTHARAAQMVLKNLHSMLKQGKEIDIQEVDAEIRVVEETVLHEDRVETQGDELVIRTRKKVITPRTDGQRAYMNALLHSEMVFGVGPAGTGKTYLACAIGVALMLEGQYDRIILSRPAVEAGEKLGFLPGDLREKVDPYLRPLFDALNDMLPPDQVVKRMERGDIEVAPLAFMRGRTLSKAFVILDEAQNTTPMQMKMFLTRMGEGSKMVIVGDLTQVDLPTNQMSGLREAITLLNNVEGVDIINLKDIDIVRHPLITRIVNAYDRGKVV